MCVLLCSSSSRKIILLSIFKQNICRLPWSLKSTPVNSSTLNLSKWYRKLWFVHNTALRTFSPDCVKLWTVEKYLNHNFNQFYKPVIVVREVASLAVCFSYFYLWLIDSMWSLNLLQHYTDNQPLDVKFSSVGNFCMVKKERHLWFRCGFI